ncbi:hypothetical protein P88_00290 [Erwinia phage phiEt88]|uniref:hypothetical protein n=1 Tax=Erwinia phage phiEt88 TaxID=925984 RepID=UPI0001F1FC6D|nr:hypothetical protein ErPhphiEt88_gp29 [Erwinia phage phiEt88]CBX44540.1 hypothetical protein P88_00290 [Erwinia phage phiEt88]
MKENFNAHSISDIGSLSWRKSILVVFVAIMSGLAPAYLFSYAYLDDYAFVQQLIDGSYHGVQWDVMSGRPAYAMFRALAFIISTDMESLELLRLFSSISIAGLGVYLFSFLASRNILKNNSDRVILAIFTCLIPSFQVYASWFTCFPFAISVLLALASYDVLTSDKKMHLLLKLLISSILIIISFSVYQPTAMCFLVFVFIDNCIGDKTISYRKIFLSFFVTCIGVLSSALMAKVIPMMIYGNTLDRAKITHDFIGKLNWFIDQPLMMSINNYSITPSDSYTLISSALVIVGLSTFLSENDSIKKVILSIILALGSFSLNLIVSESWAAYRSLVGISMIASTLFLLGIFRLSSKAGNFRSTILFIVLVCVVVSSQYNIIRGFIITQRGEMQALSSEVARIIPKDYTGNVMFDLSDPAYYAFEKLQVSDEFGGISSAAPWAIPGMVNYIKVKKGFKFVIPEDPIITDLNRCESDCIILKSSDALRRATSNY